MRKLAYWVLFSAIQSLPGWAGFSIARADQPGAATPDAEAEKGAVNATPASAPAPAPAPAPVVTAKPTSSPTSRQSSVEAIGKPARLPVYVADWGRLAELTRSDPLVFPQADFWADRQEHVRWILGGGLFVGVSVGLAGAVARLATDHWTDTAERGVAAGVSLAAISLLAAWALSPERDDLLTAINQWNLRHPDRPLAP